MSEQIVDKINKLLAKAESTTPAEAEALTERAQKLMIKYGIEQAMLDREDSGRVGSGEQIVQKIVVSSGTYVAVMHDMAQLIMGALNLKGVQTKKEGGRQALFVIGFETDVAFAVQLIQSLQAQAQTAMKAWWSDARSLHHWASSFEKFKEREQFIQAFAVAAAERIRFSRRQVIKEKTAESSDGGAGMELALRDRSQQIDDYMTDAFPNLRKGRPSSRSGGSFSSAMAGNDAGKRADIHQTRVGSNDRGRIAR